MTTGKHHKISIFFTHSLVVMKRIMRQKFTEHLPMDVKQRQYLVISLTLTPGAELVNSYRGWKLAHPVHIGIRDIS